MHRPLITRENRAAHGPPLGRIGGAPGGASRPNKSGGRGEQGGRNLCPVFDLCCTISGRVGQLGHHSKACELIKLQFYLIVQLCVIQLYESGSDPDANTDSH